jgi:maleylacetate reductase
VIVRWGLGELPGVLEEAGIDGPFLVAGPRWSGLALPEAHAIWSEVPSERIDDAAAAAAGAGGVLAVGGGSAIDLGKAVSAATGLRLVSVPTTYSGAEWTTFFGVRDPSRRMRGGGTGANLAGIVYEPLLTLELPRAESGGTALNALAHCAEALYVRGHNEEADEWALRGAARIGAALPRVLANGRDQEARSELLHGAEEAGRALGGSGLALGHAMAQALGGRYGLPHGAMNALCLPPALRFNEPAAAEAVARFGNALGTENPAARVEELARLAGFERLRDFDVPEAELAEVAQAASERAGARANPRTASADEIEQLYRSIW